jgi:beta-glucanase (GH16 family)
MFGKIKIMRAVLFAYMILVLGCGDKKSSSEPQPTVSISDIAQTEGNVPGAIGVTIQLSKPATTAITVSYSTLDGTARAGEDYVAVTNQSVTIQPNEISKAVFISIVGDDVREADDNFTVMLTGATGAILGQTTATMTIMNDDLHVPFTNAGYDAPAGYPGYTLVWTDDFNSGSLDAAAWAVQGGDGCPTICGWGNNEQEYYTGRPENLFFQDGKLIIEARKESFGGKPYTSSKIISKGKKFFKYGRIDIRAKLPKGKGIWPALWMLPENNVYGGWPTSGEIDIMELVGHEPGKVYGTLHFGPGPGSTMISRGYTLAGSAAFNDEFHVFSMEWKQDQIKLFVDNNLYSTVNKTDVTPATYPFNEDFFFIFNLAVGGNWPGNPDASTLFPQWMIVDYIRVYQ